MPCCLEHRNYVNSSCVYSYLGKFLFDNYCPFMVNYRVSPGGYALVFFFLLKSSISFFITLNLICFYDNYFIFWHIQKNGFDILKKFISHMYFISDMVSKYLPFTLCFSLVGFTIFLWRFSRPTPTKKYKIFFQMNDDLCLLITQI